MDSDLAIHQVQERFRSLNALLTLSCTFVSASDLSVLLLGLGLASGSGLRLGLGLGLGLGVGLC